MDQIQTGTDVETPAEILAEDLDAESVDAVAADETEAAEMGELAVEDWDYQRPKRGQVRIGVILAMEEQEIIVDVGAKRDGVVPYADLQRMGPEALAELSVGDEVPVFVLRPEDRDGNLLVSLFLARQEKAWMQAQELADSGEVWEGLVDGFNKGGLVVPVKDIRGFVPASQVPGFPRGLSQEDRLARLSEMVGETLHVKVIEINRRKRRLILSATAAQQQSRKASRERILSELREGEVRKGCVSSLSPFGAFVDLGGADGLIHLSELSWRRVRHPREVVKVGDEVEVYVLRLDQEKQRIGLSLKRLQPEPWALVEDTYELGQLVEGTVTNVVDFGAFAEIEAGVEGLIHVSELTDASIEHPRDVVKRGDFLLLRIIRVDARRKRLGLSLRRVLESEWAEWAARLAVDKPPEPQPVVESPPAAVEEEAEDLAAEEARLEEEPEPQDDDAGAMGEDLVESAEIDASEPAAPEEVEEVLSVAQDPLAELEQEGVTEAGAPEVPEEPVATPDLPEPEIGDLVDAGADDTVGAEEVDLVMVEPAASAEGVGAGSEGLE